VCSSSMPLSDLAPNEGFENCDAGHLLNRCVRSFLLVESTIAWECPVCKAIARPFNTPPEAGEATPLPAWLSSVAGTGMWCPHCHVPCCLLNV
jgi:hypothetical protein